METLSQKSGLQGKPFHQIGGISQRQAKKETATMKGTLKGKMEGNPIIICFQCHQLGHYS